jgi:hypothetical protein
MLTGMPTGQPENAELTSPVGVGEFTFSRQPHKAAPSPVHLGRTKL